MSSLIRRGGDGGLTCKWCGDVAGDVAGCVVKLKSRGSRLRCVVSPRTQTTSRLGPFVVVWLHLVMVVVVRGVHGGAWW